MGLDVAGAGLELGELKLGGFDLSLTGFGDLELKDLLAERTGQQARAATAARRPRARRRRKSKAVAGGQGRAVGDRPRSSASSARYRFSAKTATTGSPT
jgi:hypothetical protein